MGSRYRFASMELEGRLECFAVEVCRVETAAKGESERASAPDSDGRRTPASILTPGEPKVGMDMGLPALRGFS